MARLLPPLPAPQTKPPSPPGPGTRHPAPAQGSFKRAAAALGLGRRTVDQGIQAAKAAAARAGYAPPASCNQRCIHQRKSITAAPVPMKI